MFKREYYIAYNYIYSGTTGFGSILFNYNKKIKNWENITEIKEAIIKFTKEESNKILKKDDIVIINWKKM